jgi:hypothetical protein
MNTAPRALFILKLREDYGQDVSHYKPSVASGMFNSATFVADMLNNQGIEAKVIVVIDNNCIDREVTAYKPTHVFIEGYWVVPEKFDVLKPLHPKVQWIVRCHSEVPFLAQEGIAMEWTFNYWKRGIAVAGNAPRIHKELQLLAHNYPERAASVSKLTPYLPNYYPITDQVWIHHSPWRRRTELNIGCFGAVRPMKNHLAQAIAAIEFANFLELPLKFHINLGRNEMMGANVLKNLRGLFDNVANAELVEITWTNHDEFLDVIRGMDMCLQVSFTETFNIVTADTVVVGVPVVTSPEIAWASKSTWADPTSTDNMVCKMKDVWVNARKYCRESLDGLAGYSLRSITDWTEFLV